MKNWLRKKTLAPPAGPETDRDIAWTLGALTLAAAPHSAHLPIWITVLLGITVIWRYVLLRLGRPLPGTTVLMLLTAAAAGAILWTYGTFFGREAGVALLAAMVALKLLELRSARDVVAVILISYFLMVAEFLYSQTIVTAVYVLFAALVATAALVGSGLGSSSLPARLRFRTAATLLAQAIPLTLLLFVFFPRISGPLWGLPKDAYAGLSGLSDTMSPGSISNLSLSDAVAFRVRFHGRVPRPDQRYWRGPVLWQFDGRTWTQGRKPVHEQVRFGAYGSPVNYTVTLEPDDKSWLFALDLPATVPPSSRINADYQLIADKPVRTRLRYDISSYPDYQAGVYLSDADRSRGLQLPPGGNQKARQLAEEWRQQATGPADIVKLALEYLHREPFRYTLSPPPLGREAVDSFLFHTRSGFCEHYASSFTFLMRAAGVPARIVTGYQGGELNPLGQYLIVRQSDAHAWVEVWLPNRGWVRVDPTAAVAPSRVQAGIDAALPAGDPVPGLAFAEHPWLRNLRYSLDAVTNSWNQWVLGYDQERQYALMDRFNLGFASWRGMALVLALGLGWILSALAGWMWWKKRLPPPDRVRALYEQFCAKLARAGTARHPHEGPEDYRQRLLGRHPDLAAEINAATDLYIALRYGRQPTEQAFEEFRDRVRSLVVS